MQMLRGLQIVARSRIEQSGTEALNLSGERCGSYEASATFGGSNGVPVQTWSLCQFGSELIWQLATNESSGSVDIKAMTTWLENKGYLPGNSTVTALSFGFEISSTGGQNVKFSVSNFSINT